MRRLPLTLVALALVLTACGDDTRAATDTPERVDRGELDDVVLAAREAPPGTAYLAERSGTLFLEELWPSDCCPGQQLSFREAGFTTAFARVFQKPGYAGNPIDTRPGWELVSSAAVLFRTEEGASDAIDAWLGYYESPALDALPADDLGEEAIAVTGSPEAPAETFYLYLWRVGKVVLALRASTGTGSVPPEQVRALVDRMDARVS